MQPHDLQNLFGNPDVEVTVRVDHHGQVHVEPDLPPLVQLATSRVVLQEIEDGSVALSRSPESLTRHRELRRSAGLMEALVYELVRQGVAPERIHVRGHTRSPGALVHRDDIPDHRVAQLITLSEHGLIKYGPGADPIKLLVDLIRLLPEARFAIATASQGRAKKICKRLRKLGIAVTLLRVDGDCRHEPGSVVVGTWSSLSDHRAEVNKRSILIVPRATDALHDNAVPCLTQPDLNCRVVGMLSTQATLSPFESDRLTAIFGFEWLTIPAIRVEQRLPMIMSQRYSTGGIPPEAEALAIKRRLWQDDVRNRLIGKWAKRYLAGDYRELQSQNHSHDHALNLPPCNQVIILADVVEHAGHLARLLPDWAVHTRNAFLEGLPPHLSRALRNGSGGWHQGDRWIMTTEGAEDIELPQSPGLTIVIWAGAGPGLPPLPPSWLQAPVGSGRKLLLVDIHQRYHPVLRKWTRSREEAYAQAEWLPPGTCPVTHRIKQFWARQEGAAQ